MLDNVSAIFLKLDNKEIMLSLFLIQFQVLSFNAGIKETSSFNKINEDFILWMQGIK